MGPSLEPTESSALAGPPLPSRDVDALVAVLERRSVAVLTGAGCSTESGIPDYRGPATRQRVRSPIQYEAFLGDASVRQRYWARSMAGWPRMHAARPNAAHHALAKLEARGVIKGLITQNVDRLHTRAGHRALIELHGALHEVRCLACGLLEDRTALQQRLQALNPGFSEQSAHLAPDGDADLPVDVLARFVVAGCRSCGGTLKPNVVFFGENVAQAVVARAHAMISGSEVLLVVGSSLTVLSGYRFVRAAARQGIPVAIINLGSTRGDAEATLKVDASAGIMLPLLAAALCTSG